MTKSALQAILNEYGAKVKLIKCTGSIVVLNTTLGNNMLTNDDIVFKSFGGEDFITFKEINCLSGKFNTVMVPVSDVIKVVATETEKEPFDIYRI